MIIDKVIFIHIYRLLQEKMRNPATAGFAGVLVPQDSMVAVRTEPVRKERHNHTGRQPYGFFHRLRCVCPVFNGYCPCRKLQTRLQYRTDV